MIIMSSNIQSEKKNPNIFTHFVLFCQRDIIAVGVDTPSTDYGESTTFETHVILGQNNVLGLENVANMDLVPPRNATMVIGLVKLGDGSGGSARLLAMLPDDSDVAGSASRVTISTQWLWCLGLILSVGGVRG
jgi:kynurenine formamidase